MKSLLLFEESRLEDMAGLIHQRMRFGSSLHHTGFGTARTVGQSQLRDAGQKVSASEKLPSMRRMPQVLLEGADQLQCRFEAQLARQHSDLEMLVSYTQAAAALQERAHAEPEWRNFGNALRLDADQSMKQKDWKTAYHLYLAASITNPDDAWAQYGLEEARRNDILGGPESNSQAIDSSADVLYLPSNEYEKTSW